MRIERLIMTEFTVDKAEAVHLNSLDADNRRFVPDEVFETVEEAAETIGFLMGVYENGDGPLVYPILTKNDTCVGYVQAVTRTRSRTSANTCFPWNNSRTNGSCTSKMHA